MILYRADTLKINATYRGIPKKARKFVYGYYWRNLTQHFIKDIDGNDHEVRPETIGQLTDVPDARGRLVYQGDILDVGYGSNKRVVAYQDGQWIAWLLRSHYMKPLCECVDEYYVVGNIHLNKSLLKK